LEKVLATIRKDISAGEVRVDNPTQNLESYFLDVVQKARVAAQETSGAQSGARVAAYLRAGTEERPAAEKVLEKLALPQTAQPVVQPKPAVQSAAPKTDDSKLSALSQPAAPAPEKSAPKVEQTKPVDLSKADEKLLSLLGGKK
jgi:hypothetical protein